MKRLLLLLLMVAMRSHSFAQGCADAGFCSVGTMQASAPHQLQDSVRHSIGFSAGVASGEKLSWVISPQLEGRAYVSNASYVEVKLPYQVITGNLGTNHGFGDVIATFSSQVGRKKWKYPLFYTIGTRIGLGDASDEINGRPLPMAYQPNMGTTDVIAGAGMNIGKHIRLATGIQQPVIQYNRNGYSTTENRDSVATAYFSSLNLRRKGDVLLRIEGMKDWKRSGIRGGTLLLYHLGEDRSLQPGGKAVPLAGSSGLTVNINFEFYLRWDNLVFDFTLAAPVYARDNRPDGLTRNAVAIPRVVFLL